MKNWKTTFSSLGLAVVVQVAAYAAQGKITKLGLLVSVAIAVNGFFQKDKDVTGGTRVNTAPAETASQLKAEGQ